MNKRHGALWFLLGLGGQLQIVASLSISEAVILLIAPLLYFRVQRMMKRDGVSTFFNISLMTLVGCVISCIYNQTQFDFALRGVAAISIMPCTIIVSYWFLRTQPNGFKWYLLGDAFSMIICTFIFQKANELGALAHGAQGLSAVSSIMSGPLFWAGRFGPFMMLPTKGWYLNVPMLYGFVASSIMIVISLLASESGRSAALGYSGFLILLFWGGKKMSSIKRVTRHSILLFVMAIIGVFAANFAYHSLATSGLLGEKALVKYERQTQGSKSIMRLLIGGRAESFVGLFACFDRPLIGWGPWAIDTQGFTEEFIRKYGTAADYEQMLRSRVLARRQGYEIRGLIPCHSYITSFWCWYGVMGLILWLYAIFAILRYLLKDSWRIPQWYAWLACWIPVMLWKIAFSPYSDRIGTPLFIVACLMARAVRKGSFRLPLEMIAEIERVERK